MRRPLPSLAAPLRVLAAAAAATLLAACPLVLLADEPRSEPDETERPRPDLLFTEPASGSTVARNPFELRGRNVGAHVPRGLVLRSQTFVGVLRFDAERRFRIPVYLQADADGRTLPLDLRLPDRRGLGEVVATTELDLPEAAELADLEHHLAALDTALAAVDGPSAGVEQALALATRLRDAGHPIFASLALGRVDRVPPEAHAALAPVLRARLLALRLELAVILGDTDALEPLGAALRALSSELAPGAAGKREKAQLVALSEQLYLAAALALVQGFAPEAATAVHDLANDLHQLAGRLPRRLPQGY